jgi:hypothetical protein
MRFLNDDNKALAINVIHAYMTSSDSFNSLREEAKMTFSEEEEKLLNKCIEMCPMSNNSYAEVVLRLLVAIAYMKDNAQFGIDSKYVDPKNIMLKSIVNVKP